MIMVIVCVVWVYHSGACVVGLTLVAVKMLVWALPYHVRQRDQNYVVWPVVCSRKPSQMKFGIGYVPKVCKSTLE